MIRAFLAIHPGADVLEKVEAFQAELRDSGGDVRWLAPAAMHLTVQFLGDVREAELAGVERALGEALAEQTPIELECRGCGVFPNLKKPRVVWAGLSSEGLPGLAERTEIALAPLGFPPGEREEFRPHITLGRVRSMRGFDRLAEILKQHGDASFGASVVDEVVLYKSDLRPTGSIYTPILRVRLGRQ